MPRLTEPMAVALVEEAARLSPLDRAVRMYAALGGASPQEAADCPLDRRDRELFAARKAAFGTKVPVLAHCPECETTLESSVDIDALLQLEGTPDEAVRAPSSRMLAEAVGAANDDALALACRLDETLDPSRVGERLEAAFPLLDLLVGFECVECGHDFAQPFDIAACLWTELQRMADGVLDDIDAIARAYGWSEAEIMALGPVRRRAYIARIAA